MMNDSGDSLLKQAEQHLRMGNKRAALSLLTEYLHQFPNSAKGWWMMSFAVPNQATQIECLERVLELSPNSASALARLQKLKDSTGVSPFIETGNAKLQPSSEQKPSQPKLRGRQNNQILQYSVLGVMICVAASVLGFAGMLLFNGRGSVPMQAAPVAQGTSSYSEISLPPTWTPTASPTLAASLTPPPLMTSLPATPTLYLLQTSVAKAKVGVSRGYYAPDFSLTSVSDNRTVSLYDFKGKGVIVFFWATWCRYCNAEMPAMQMLYETYESQGLMVLGVDVGESASKGRAYKEKNSITFPILNDAGNNVAATYQVTGFPTHYFIDPNGVITSINIGGMDYWALAEKVKGMLNIQ
jgi:peroxiredoxin